MCRAVLLAVCMLAACRVSLSQELISQRKQDQLFESGTNLLAHREYGAAYKSFDEFLHVCSSGDSRAIEAEYNRAYCATNLYHSNSDKLLLDFIERHPHDPNSSRAYYEMASHAYEGRDYAKASGYFAKVDFPLLAVDDQNTGRFRWGYSLFTQRDLLTAQDQFNVIKATGGTYGPAASYYAGFIELSAGDYDNALIDLKRAETSPSYASLVPVLIATVYSKQKDDAKLIKYCDEARARENVSSGDALALLSADAFFRQGNYSVALDRYKEYLEGRDHNDRGTLYRAGYSAHSTGKQDDALRFFSEAASEKDSIGRFASYYLGSIYLSKQQKPLALTAFATAGHTGKPASLAEESQFMCAKINYELGNPDASIRGFEDILKNFPQSVHAAEIRELLSQAYVNANNYNKAIEYIEAMPRRVPLVDQAYQKATFLKGTELFNKEEYSMAAVNFEKSLGSPLDPDLVAETSFWLGETFSLGKKYEQAVPAYERALGHAKGNLLRQIRYGLGYAHFNLQHYDKAALSFKDFASKATIADPNYADGVLRLADCNYVLKSYNDALTYYRQVIQWGSADSDYAHLQRGIILSILRRYGDASTEFQVVAKNSSSLYTDDAIFQLGQISFEQSNYPAAIAHYTTLIEAGRSLKLLPYALNRRAAAYFNMKEYARTANDYITVLDKFPSHPASQDLLLPLQESLTLSNRAGEFDKYLDQFKKANPGAHGIESVEFEAAKSLYFNQNYAKAIEAVTRFANSYPESPNLHEAKYYQAESFYRQKDFKSALALYEELMKNESFLMRNKVAGRVGELQFKLGNYDQAASAFRLLIRISQNKKDEFTAWNGLLESYYLLALYDSADVYAHKILVQGSVNANAQSKATLFLGKSAKARGDYEGAKDEFLLTLNSARDEYGAEAKYLLAEIFYLKGDSKACYSTLIELNEEFKAYEDWVGKSFLLLADNFLLTGDTFQARGTLNSLIENFPQESIKELAKSKLKEIDDAERRKNPPAKPDSTDNR